MLVALTIAVLVAAVSFPLCFVFKRDTASPPALLSGAILVSAILELFDLLTLYNPEQFYLWKKCSLLSEAIMIPVWLCFTLTYARQGGFKAISLPLRILLSVSPLFFISAVILPINSFIYSPDFVAEKIIFLNTNGFIFYIFMLVYLVIALIQLEFTLAETTWSARWKIKFELLGAGAFLILLIVYYSQGLLFRTINMQLVPIRCLVLIVAIVMMMYSRVTRGSAVSVQVSQQIACKSVVLLAVGVYIICLGLVGEGVKFFGAGYQRTLMLTLLFFAGFGMLSVLFSESLKRRVKVFIHTNFYQYKYDYRYQWLFFTDQISKSQTNDSLLKSIVSEFCYTFGMGTGALFIVNEKNDGFHQAAAFPMECTEVTFGNDDPLIESLGNKRFIVDLRNNLTTVDNEQHRTFFSATDACFIIPLAMRETLCGFIMVGKPHINEEIYTSEDFNLMRTLAKQTSSALLNLRLSEQLASSRELAAVGKVSAFVMHDLKNLISSISLMVMNAETHIKQPEFQRDLFECLRDTVTRMNSLVLRLKELPDKNSLQLTSVDLLQMARETAAMANMKSLEVTGDHVIATADREELQKVALNLMLNAIEATDGSSQIKVEVGESGSPYIRVKDEGCGIAESAIKNFLFKPFKSTKKQGMGIGLYQSRQIIEAHGGRIDVTSSINQGSEFTVWLPKMQPETA